MILKLPGKHPSRKSDEELLESYVSSGDIAFLGDLYSEYMHLVYGVCLKYLKNRDESMDAVMQIFEKLIIEIPKHEILNFKNWLYVLTKNFCLMKIRSQKYDVEKMQNWINDTQIFMETEPYMHPIDDERPDLDKALQDCIERLKDEQKDCIRMFYFDNMSYSEIGDNLRLDEKKVKSYLQNGKRNLKICLEEKNGKKE